MRVGHDEPFYPMSVIPRIAQELLSGIRVIKGPGNLCQRDPAHV
jgi:hypothetical protein